MATPFVTIKEACDFLRVGRSYFYDLVKDEKIHLVKMGRKSFVTKGELDRFVSEIVSK